MMLCMMLSPREVNCLGLSIMGGSRSAPLDDLETQGPSQEGTQVRRWGELSGGCCWHSVPLISPSVGKDTSIMESCLRHASGRD